MQASKGSGLLSKWSSTSQTHKLPNGIAIRHVSTPAEVQFLYKEQFVDKVYLRHGVCLHPGSTVLDCGANIGLFSMFCAEAAGGSGLVVSCEPAPAAAAALKDNLQHHAQCCAAAGTQVATSIVVPAAVGDGSQQQAALTVYSGASGWSTLMRDDKEVLHNTQIYLQHLVAGDTSSSSSSSNNGSSGSSSGSDTAAPGDSTSSVTAGPEAQGWSPAQQLLVAAARLLSSTGVLRPMSQQLAKWYVENVMMRQADSVTVDVFTISQLLQQYNLRSIDLLKIDVERGEWQVLQGVQPQDWQRIKQVALEVHDVGGRLNDVVQLLKEQGGFTSVVWEQDSHFGGSNLYNVYATRR